MQKAAQPMIIKDHLLELLSLNIKSIDRRLSSTVSVVHHSTDNKSQENITMAIPARKQAAAQPARRPVQKPVDDFDDFDTAPDTGAENDGFDDLDGFDEAPATPARKTGKSAPPPADEFDEFEGAEGEASEDPTTDDFEGFEEGAEPQQQDDDEFGETEQEPEPEPEPVLHPKLKNGDYVLPKGSKAWYVTGDDDGGWKRDRQAVDTTTKNLKLVYNKSQHNYPVNGVEDKNGKTYVVLGYNKEWLVVTTAESLIDPTTRKAPKILQPKEAAPVAKVQAAAKAAPASALTKAQTLAVRKLRAAYAEFEAAFADIA